MRQDALEEFISDYQYHLHQAVDRMAKSKIISAIKLLQACHDVHGTVWLIGNGGSAALASHMAVDLQLAGLKAIALSDGAAISSYGNDCGFKDSFSTPLSGMLDDLHDVGILISTSGNSENILQAAKVFDNHFCPMITLTGHTGGALVQQDFPRTQNINIICPLEHTGQIQDMHQIYLHLIAYWLMKGQLLK